MGRLSSATSQIDVFKPTPKTKSKSKTKAKAKLKTKPDSFLSLQSLMSHTQRPPANIVEVKTGRKALEACWIAVIRAWLLTRVTVRFFSAW
jgi:hypothetical protein